MDDLLNFIADNPWALIVAFFLLARLFGGGKKKATTPPGARAKTIQEKRAQAQVNRASKQEEIEKRLAEQLRSLGIDVPVTTRRSSSPQQTTPPPSRQASTETEFHQVERLLGNEMDVEREGRSTGSFGFHKAIDESEEKEYHMTGFGFHEAQGLHTLPLDMTVEPTPEGVSPITIDDEAVRQGILMSEILGPPVSFRRGGRGGYKR